MKTTKVCAGDNPRSQLLNVSPAPSSAGSVQTLPYSIIWMTIHTHTISLPSSQKVSSFQAQLLWIYTTSLHFQPFRKTNTYDWNKLSLGRLETWNSTVISIFTIVNRRWNIREKQLSEVFDANFETGIKNAFGTACASSKIESPIDFVIETNISHSTKEIHTSQHEQ